MDLMAVRRVPNSRSTHTDKTAPGGGTQARGPVRTSAPAHRGTGVGGPAGRNNSGSGSEEGRGNVRTTPKSNNF